MGDWNDRLYLLDHLDKLGTDSRADAFVTRYRARWVYFDEVVFGLFHHRVHLDTLMHSKSLQLVFERGTVHVFRIGAPA